MRCRAVVSVALAASAVVPQAAAKEPAQLVVVGADGRSVVIRDVGEVARPSVTPAGGPYLRLYRVGRGGFPGTPGRFYPASRIVCDDWNRGRLRCSRATASVLRALAPATRLRPFRGRSTVLATLIPGDGDLNLRAAVELAFDRYRATRPSRRPAPCLAFRASWRGPRSELRPRRFCISKDGVYARGRLHPLGPAVWWLARADARHLLPPRCAVPIRSGPRGLPAPVVLETGCARYTIAPDGRVSAARPRVSPCRGTTAMLVAGQGACLVDYHGRFAVVRGGRELWISTRRYRLAGVFALVGPRTVAFSYDRYDRKNPSQGLYLARFGGPEREIARDERPLGWTRDGRLVTWRFRGAFGLFLRSADGRLLRRLARNLRDFRFDRRTRTVIAVTRDWRLVRIDVERRETLADLTRLGFPRGAAVHLLAGGLVGVVGRTRVAVLRRDGSLLASAAFPPAKRRLVAGNSGLVARGDGRAVAFAVTDANDGYRARGREAVYVLLPGDRAARLVYSAPIRFAVCERWASLAWHRDWLLYATTEGRTLALDIRRGSRIDLTRLAARVAPRTWDGRRHVNVEWSD